MSQRKSLTQAHIKAVFLSDIRGKFKKCQICSKEFGFTRAEHQCKRCRRAVCEKCSNNKLAYITETGPSKRPRRVCDICKEESQWIRRFIEQQKVSIGVDTFANEWLKASGLTVEMAKEEFERAQQDMNKDKGEFLKMKQELQAAMIELWLNLNYSFREFFSYMIKESEYESVSQRVSRVLGTLLIQYPDIGYCSDQVLITVFLLCFASEASAYALLTIIYSEVIPFNTYPAQLRKYPYDYTSEVDKILQVIEQAFRLKQSEINLIKPFIRNKIARYLQPLGINFFILQTSFFFINQTLLNPKNGYDNLLKCLASAFSIRYEEIKHFPSSFDEAESQLLKGVLSGDLEKSYLQTKLIIFLSHNHGMTQSVIINRPLETKQQVVHQIKIEHIQDQKTQRKIEQEDDMLQYTVLQDNDFQILRRKTVQIQAQPQVDEEKANLKEYIEKVEETLMLKHKLVVQLQNRIKELENLPPQIVNKDADQQLINANEQLRMRIAAQDQEIYVLQEQKKYSDKLQEDSQLIISNLKKSNFELNEQLNSQIQSNRELQTTVTLLRTQVEQSTGQQQIEKNYQINISVQSKHTEDKLLLQLEEERQKIFNLEISNNQMNKEYIALQQLNQDKLRIIGNLEVRLIQAEAAKKDRERYYIELVELRKKLEGHELAIIHQQEQYNILLEGFNKQNIEIDLLKREKLTLSEEHQKRESELQLIISSLRSQLQELQAQLDSITIQLNQSLQINQKLQNLIVEKDQNIEQLNIKIRIEIRRYEELTIQLSNTIEEHKRILSEKELLILNLRSDDSSLRDQLQQLRNELEVKSQLILKLQVEFDTHRQNSQNFESKYLIVFNELDQLKNQWNILNHTHITLVETHRLTLLELDNLRGQHSSLLSEHTQLSEKHKLIIIELDDFRNRWTTLQREHHELNEKHRLIIIELQTVNDRCLFLTSQQNESSSKHNLIIIELNQFKDRFNSLTEQYNQLNEKHNIVVLELNSMKDKYNILTREHNQLNEQHRLVLIQLQTLDENHKVIILELNTIKQNYDSLTREHHSLNEQHRLLLIQFQTLDEKHRLLIIEHNTLQEQHRLIVIQFNSTQQYQIDINEKNRIIDELRLLLQQSEDKYNLLFSQNKQLQDKYQIDIQIHLKRVSELELLIVELEKKLLEMNNTHNSLRIQIEQYISRISILESEKSEYQKNYNELQILSQNYKVTIISLEERITVLVAEVSQKETYIKELLIIIEKQKVSIIDYEELIRKLKAQIVDQEKQIAKLKLTLKQFKELSTELAQID